MGCCQADAFDLTHLAVHGQFEDARAKCIDLANFGSFGRGQEQDGFAIAILVAVTKGIGDFDALNIVFGHRIFELEVQPALRRVTTFLLSHFEGIAVLGPSFYRLEDSRAHIAIGDLAAECRQTIHAAVVLKEWRLDIGNKFRAYLVFVACDVGQFQSDFVGLIMLQITPLEQFSALA